MEDATKILLNLSQCPAPARSMVLELLLKGAATLGYTVAQHINCLLEDLKRHAAAKASAAASSAEGASSQHLETHNKGLLRDRSVN